MDKYKRYLGVVFFIVSIMLMFAVAAWLLAPQYDSWINKKAEHAKVTATLEDKQAQKQNIVLKLKKLKESVMTAQKKIYTPIEDKLGSDTLFFTLYSDIIEMVHSNTIKIKSIDYKYNPSGDPFVAQGATYFVCDVNLEVISNYVNLGKLIQDIYQYPYYIKIINIDVVPYPKDKKILLTKLSLRTYAHTSPEEADAEADTAVSQPAVEGAVTPLPQQ